MKQNDDTQPMKMRVVYDARGDDAPLTDDEILAEVEAQFWAAVDAAGIDRSEIQISTSGSHNERRRLRGVPPDRRTLLEQDVHPTR